MAALARPAKQSAQAKATAVVSLHFCLIGRTAAAATPSASAIGKALIGTRRVAHADAANIVAIVALVERQPTLVPPPLAIAVHLISPIRLLDVNPVKPIIHVL